MPDLTPADIALADDIADELNTRWPELLTATRDWLPDLKAKNEIDTLKVSICPSPNPTGEPLERGQTWETWPIDVGFAKRLTLKTREEIDELIATVDRVRTLLQASAFVLGDGRRFEPAGRFEFLARFDPELLNRAEDDDGEAVYTGVFLSVVRFEFQLLI